MSFLPASTNDAYQGAPIAAGFLGVHAILTIVPGLIHYALPDGGAGVIANLDLSQSGPLIIAVFAWMGATQIPWGLAQLAVALRWRSLTPLFLLLVLLERVLAALAAWVLKPSQTGHHPPEHYGVLIGTPLILLFLVLSIRAAAPFAARKQHGV